MPVMMPLLERSEGSLSGIGVAVAVEYQQATVSQAIKKGKHRSRIFGLMSGKGRSKSKSKGEHTRVYTLIAQRLPLSVLSVPLLLPKNWS